MRPDPLRNLRRADFHGRCKCRHCQYKSGTGHGSYLTFANRADVNLTGNATQWDVAADNGNVKTHTFCPTCGSPVWLTFSMMADLFTVHAASLDDPARYKPQAVTYTMSGYPWDHLGPALQKFEKMPG